MMMMSGSAHGDGGRAPDSCERGTCYVSKGCLRFLEDYVEGEDEGFGTIRFMVSYRMDAAQKAIPAIAPPTTRGLYMGDPSTAYSVF